MYLTLISLPLLGSIVSGFFGRKVGVVGSHIITCSCVIITTLLAFIAFIEVGFNNIPVSINLFRWVDSESVNVLWGFNFDSLTVSMLIPVLVVSSLVHLYSIEYMSHDPHNQRFFSYLSLFTFMMIILVTANNFLLMFVGWEGVGVCSYLLVSFWFTRIAANQSSLAAFLTNRVGDCLLTVGMFALLWSFGNIDYATVFTLAPFMNENIITIIGLCLLIGAMAKSSQVGLHIWLPMAMEGPTPVSALIHAATMVTAGVYLLMRSSPLLEYSSTVLLCCLWLGAITTVFSSLIGLFQQDIKKVIAYSTMSQLGMMVIAIGLSSYNVALFHLVNHAFYKALLFLGAGAVIHAVSDNQDFRKYGGLRQFLPLTYSVMLIASLSLVAFPFMTGFYSKDFILESAYGQFTFSGVAVYFIATIGAMFTTLYSIKVLYVTFLSNPLGPITNYENAHEGKLFMSLPLIVLAVFSIFFGYITKDIFIGLGSSFFADNSLFIHPNHEIMLDTEFAVPTLYKLLPLIFTVSLTLISLVLSEFLPWLLLLFKISHTGYNIFGFFNQRFLIELFYNKYITTLVFKLGGQTTKVLDKGSVELVGPYGLEKGIVTLSKNLSKLDTGVVTSYASYILFGLTSYLLVTYLSLLNVNLLILLFVSILTYINNSYNKMLYIYEVKSINTLNSSILPNLKNLKGNIIAKLTSKHFWLKVIIMAFIALVFRYLFFKYLSVNVFTDFDKYLTYVYYPLIAFFKNLLDILIPERSFTGLPIVRVPITKDLSTKDFSITEGLFNTMGHPASIDKPVFKHPTVSNPTILAMDNTGTGNKRKSISIADLLNPSNNEVNTGNTKGSNSEAGPSKRPRLLAKSKVETEPGIKDKERLEYEAKAKARLEYQNSARQESIDHEMSMLRQRHTVVGGTEEFNEVAALVIAENNVKNHPFVQAWIKYSFDLEKNGFTINRYGRVLPVDDFDGVVKKRIMSGPKAQAYAGRLLNVLHLDSTLYNNKHGTHFLSPKDIMWLKTFVEQNNLTKHKLNSEPVKRALRQIK